MPYWDLFELMEVYVRETSKKQQYKGSVLGTYRVLRVPLSIATILEIDRMVESQTGGFDSRSDLIREAVEAYVAELKYGVADGKAMHRGTELALITNSSTLETPRLSSADSSAVNRQSEFRSALGPVPKCVVVSAPVATIEEGPLFFHNRDFPSLWAAHSIAELTQAALTSFENCMRLVTQRAWKFAAALKSLPMQALKPTALFPTNREKKEASEAAFRSFAIGGHSQIGNDIRARGPLFTWKMCQLELVDGELTVGLTDIGFQLLEDLADISAEMPHSEALANRFLGHLRDNVPDDWWGFETITRIASLRPTRQELTAHFECDASNRGYRWSQHQVANYANGYVSRSREWGLIEPKQDGGRYRLTQFGETLVRSGT
jgi:Arc/MetJ-type ribon-helix-helix transcriptional regulator